MKKLIVLLVCGYGLFLLGVGAWQLFGSSGTSVVGWASFLGGLGLFAFVIHFTQVGSDDEVVSFGFKKLRPDSQLPSYKTDGAACADICAVEGGRIDIGETLAVATGLAAEIPLGYEMQIRSRSGLASKGIVVANSPGTVDSDYRGEIKVLLHNNGVYAFTFQAGDRIAQIKIAPVSQFKFVEVPDLSKTKRGHGGFGSTGT